MSAKAQRIAKGLLLVERDETRERLELLKHKARLIGGDLEAIAEKLKSNPEDLEFHSDGLVLAEYKKLGGLVEDIKVTMAKLQEIESTLEHGKIAG